MDPKSFRIVIVDHYMTSPTFGLDVTYSEFRGSSTLQVPVIRIFGSTDTGKKVCLHVHGVFPYMYVPYDGSDSDGANIHQFAATIDKMVNILLGQASSMVQHVYKISIVSGIPFYGYHSKEHQFLKIYLYNPILVKKVSGILQNEAVMGRLYQPHEAHIPFTMQFMIDYNLHGMSYIHISDLKYRMTIDSDNSLNKQSYCELEADVLPEHILNRLEVSENKLAVNPGIAALWEDEKQRRRNNNQDSEMGQCLSLDTKNVGPTDSHFVFKRALIDRLTIMADENEAHSSFTDSFLYPAETPDDSDMLDASFVDTCSAEHLRQSQTLDDTIDNSFSNRTLDADGQRLLEVLQNLGNNVPDNNVSSNKTLDPDEQCLLEVLQELGDQVQVEEGSILSQAAVEQEDHEDENDLDLSVVMESVLTPTKLPVPDMVQENSDEDIWDTTLVPQVDGNFDTSESTPSPTRASVSSIDIQKAKCERESQNKYTFYKVAQVNVTRCDYKSNINLNKSKNSKGNNKSAFNIINDKPHLLNLDSGKCSCKRNNCQCLILDKLPIQNKRVTRKQNLKQNKNNNTENFINKDAPAVNTTKRHLRSKRTSCVDYFESTSETSAETTINKRKTSKPSASLKLVKSSDRGSETLEPKQVPLNKNNNTEIFLTKDAEVLNATKRNFRNKPTSHDGYFESMPETSNETTANKRKTSKPSASLKLVKSSDQGVLTGVSTRNRSKKETILNPNHLDIQENKMLKVTNTRRKTLTKKFPDMPSLDMCIHDLIISTLRNPIKTRSEAQVADELDISNNSINLTLKTKNRKQKDRNIDNKKIDNNKCTQKKKEKVQKKRAPRTGRKLKTAKVRDNNQRELRGYKKKHDLIKPTLRNALKARDEEQLINVIDELDISNSITNITTKTTNRKQKDTDIDNKKRKNNNFTLKKKKKAEKKRASKTGGKLKSAKVRNNKKRELTAYKKRYVNKVMRTLDLLNKGVPPKFITAPAYRIYEFKEKTKLINSGTETNRNNSKINIISDILIRPATVKESTTNSSNTPSQTDTNSANPYDDPYIVSLLRSIDPSEPQLIPDCVAKIHYQSDSQSIDYSVHLGQENNPQLPDTCQNESDNNNVPTFVDCHKISDCLMRVEKLNQRLKTILHSVTANGNICQKKLLEKYDKQRSSCKDNDGLAAAESNVSVDSSNLKVPTLRKLKHVNLAAKFLDGANDSSSEEESTSQPRIKRRRLLKPRRCKMLPISITSAKTNRNSLGSECGAGLGDEAKKSDSMPKTSQPVAPSDLKKHKVKRKLNFPEMSLHNSTTNEEHNICNFRKRRSSSLNIINVSKLNITQESSKITSETFSKSHSVPVSEIKSVENSELANDYGRTSKVSSGVATSSACDNCEDFRQVKAKRKLAESRIVRKKNHDEIIITGPKEKTKSKVFAEERNVATVGAEGAEETASNNEDLIKRVDIAKVNVKRKLAESGIVRNKNYDEIIITGPKEKIKSKVFAEERNVTTDGAKGAEETVSKNEDLVKRVDIAKVKVKRKLAESGIVRNKNYDEIIITGPKGKTKSKVFAEERNVTTVGAEGVEENASNNEDLSKRVDIVKVQKQLIKENLTQMEPLDNLLDVTLTEKEGKEEFDITLPEDNVSEDDATTTENIRNTLPKEQYIESSKKVKDYGRDKSQNILEYIVKTDDPKQSNNETKNGDGVNEDSSINYSPSTTNINEVIEDPTMKYSGSSDDLFPHQTLKEETTKESLTSSLSNKTPIIPSILSGVSQKPNISSNDEHHSKLSILHPKRGPPSKDEVVESLKKYSIPEVLNPKPFYQNPEDVSGSIEVGYDILKVTSKASVHQREFTSTLYALDEFRKEHVALASSSHTKWNRTNLNNIILSFCRDENCIVMPAKPAPTKQSVLKWIGEKISNTNSNKNEKPTRKVKLYLPNSPGQGDQFDDDMNSSLSLSLYSPCSLKKSGTSENDSTTSIQASGDSVIANNECRKISLLLSDQSVNKTGEITGVTLDDTYGFRSSVEDLHKARAVTVRNGLTVLVVELHIRTRASYKPDPFYDSIRAVFYTVLRDTCSNTPDKEKGIFVVDSTPFSPDKNQKETNILNGTGVSYKTRHVKTEEEMMNEFASFVRELDPDVMAGYETEMLSLGYLIQRAYILEINLPPLLSRIRHNPKARLNKEDEELRIPGRIILDVWRLMKHEISLQSYTFENMMYHILHRRVPRYSHKDLSFWWDHRAAIHRYKTVNYYMVRVDGILELLDKLDLIGRTCELARLFGIQFYEVLSRGSQFRVESMMLRLAKPLNYIAVSPSVKQRAHMKAPEHLPLILEPESKLYNDPVIVLDFQSLYPSIIIAYNYCFSTCLGRVELLGKNTPFQFGASQYRISRKQVHKLVTKDKLNFTPCGVAFVKSEVRDGILPRMLREILDTRLMVKKSMKENKDNSLLLKVLHNRQLGLKLIANVTYGYTSANFSGRMPSVEIADSVVSKGKETLQRAMKMVDETPEWGAKVVYGDTDSLFVLVPGKSKEAAFDIGQKIADAVSNDNPNPVKLKLEKVYQPCILQTKKRYVGYMYESKDQKEPVYNAKGIETVRRDGCPAVSKILEKCLRILFETNNISLVKQYLLRQFNKIISGRVSIQDLTFSKEYRGASSYKPGACVPALELARQWSVVDKRSEPRRGERVPYVVVNGPPGLPLIRLVRDPFELLNDPSLRPNALYYITRVIIPPINRCFTLFGVEVNEWFNQMPRVQKQYLPTSSPGKRTTISQYFPTMSCAACSKQTQKAICEDCTENTQQTAVILTQKLSHWEQAYFNAKIICDNCMGMPSEMNCISLDCPVLYRLVRTNRDLQQATYVRDILSSLSF